MTKKSRWWFVVGLLITVLLAVVVSQYASKEPDGLEYVAEREGFGDQVQEHELADAPLADYGENLPANPGLSTGIAGLVGVVVAIVFGFGLFWLIRKPESDSPGSTR